MMGPHSPLRQLARNTLWTMRWPARRVTAAVRALPQFLVIGSQRAGTSSLHYWLAQHPLLQPAAIKEVHYFDGGLPGKRVVWPCGTDWYAAHFPIRARLPIGTKCFESSPLYLFHPEAAARVASTLPEAKLVVLLRDPTQRAISHYFHEKAKGRETLGLAAALDAEQDRLAPCWQQANYNTAAFVQKSYMARGEYAVQLERWLRYFPRSSLLLLNSEDLFSEPRRTLSSVFAFLGVEDVSADVVTTRHNRGISAQEADSCLRKRLDEHFASHNERLVELLGNGFNGGGHPW
jgi:hypothetical protein